MRRVVLAVLAIGVGCLIGFMIASNPVTVHGQGSAVSIAAVSGVVGGQDTFGPYDVAKNWPADISTVPGNEQWTWGAGQGIYAENPDRVFLLFRGEPLVSDRPVTVAGRDSRRLAGSRRDGPGPRGRAETLEGNCRRRRQVGTLPDDRGLERQHHPDVSAI